MTPETLAQILRIKTALLDQKSHALAEVNRRRAITEAGIAALEASVTATPDANDGIGSLHAALRWQAAQHERLKATRNTLPAIDRDILAAEEEVKLALGEKRAIERLVEDPSILAG
jgi:hypothetical protein